jgi:ABC-type polysaccharide/polyol phosphate export permease
MIGSENQTFELSSDENFARARRDLSDAMNLTWFWMALGWQDILQRYRGSILGPFWFTLTTAVFIAGLGPLYARLFSLNATEYLPFMALGVTTWQFITGTINDACGTFINSSHLMKQIRLPRFVLLFRVIWRNILIFLHNLPIYIFIFLWFDLPFDWHVLMVAPGFVVLCLNLVWIGLVVAILCARYRDITPIIGSVLQIGFFVTPVMWSYKLQSVNHWIIYANPFAAFIELVRAPMMGEPMAWPLMCLALSCLAAGSFIAAILFLRCRRQIVYWV